jgi:hypothetical protein
MKTIYLSVLFALAFSGAVAQSIFENPITGTNPNTANPYTVGQTVNANITVSGIGRGSGITGSNTNNRYNATGWNSVALDANDYFEFIITPNSGNAINFISVNFTLQNSASGPAANWVLRSSRDGFANDIGPINSNATGVSNTVMLSNPIFQNINAAITFRIYAWGASSGTGTFSVNDFVFNGVLGVLPVKLEYFQASQQQYSNTVQWKANCSDASGTNFTLQRSADGINFNTIYFDAASAFQCQLPMVFTDNSPLPGKNYYRLLMKSENAAPVLSRVILLQEHAVAHIRLLPSIIKQTATLNISALKKSQANIVITDMAGRKIQNAVAVLNAGNNSVAMDFSALHSGAYLLTVFSDNVMPSTLRFIKQ